MLSAAFAGAQLCLCVAWAPRRMRARSRAVGGRTAATHAGPTECVPSLLSGMLHLLFTVPWSAFDIQETVL